MAQATLVIVGRHQNHQLECCLLLRMDYIYYSHLNQRGHIQTGASLSFHVLQK
jgi:hypothetical protein